MLALAGVGFPACRAMQVRVGQRQETCNAGKGGSRGETCSLWIQGNLAWPTPDTCIDRTAVIKASTALVPGAPGVRLLVELVVGLFARSSARVS
jgi:hypothetical protein